MSIVISDATKDIVVTFNNDKGTPNVETLTIPATADATQADYVVLTNAWGTKIACWLDIDADGTAPTGAAYVAATVKLKISIVTGGTSAANGTIFATALDANAWSSIATIADNEDGTVTITQGKGAAVAAAVPKDADDSGDGSITATTNTTGAAVRACGVHYLPKGSFKLIQDIKNNQLVINREVGEFPQKGRASLVIPFEDVTSPATANLAALAAVIKAWDYA